MKKAILLTTVILSTLFISCGSDDDGGPQDPIVGKWQIEARFDGDTEVNISDCEKQDTFDIKADGTYTSVDNLEPNSGTACTEIQVSGTWENKGNDIYNFTVEGNTTGGNDFNITFPDGKLTFTFQGSREVYIRN